MPQEHIMSGCKRRKFTDEQKAEAVRLVREVGSIGQVAKDLDLTESALQEELRKLRRENKTLRMERDFLKKAAAFFAKDSDQRSS